MVSGERQMRKNSIARLFHESDNFPDRTRYTPGPYLVHFSRFCSPPIETLVDAAGRTTGYQIKDDAGNVLSFSEMTFDAKQRVDISNVMGKESTVYSRIDFFVAAAGP